MRKVSPIVLSIAAVASLVGASLVGSGTVFPPAYATPGSSSSSWSSSYSSSSSASSETSIPAPPPGPPPLPNNPAGGPTDFNLARDARDNPMALVGCTGTSKEPDLSFRNIGNTTISAGTTITWIVPSTGERGTFTTPKDLKPGDSVPYPAALAAALGKDGTCVAGLLG